MIDNLPPLPQQDLIDFRHGLHRVYTARQMKEYASAAVAERYAARPIDQYDYWISDYTIDRLKQVALDLGVAWPGDDAFAAEPDRFLLDVLASTRILLSKVKP